MRFEHAGEWWDLKEPSQRWAGTLRFDEETGAALTLTETFRDRRVFHPLRQYDVILGETSCGKNISLLNCFDTFKGGTSGSLGRREVYANRVLVGMHAEAIDPLVSGARVVFRHAHTWWGQSGFDRELQGSLRDVSIHYRADPPIILFDDGNARLSVYGTLASLPSQPDASGEFPLNEEVRIELTIENAAQLSVVNEMMHACQDLLSIACQDYCAIERLTVFADKEFGRQATCHAEPIFKGTRRLGQKPRLLFGFNDVEDPQRIFSAWLAEAKHLRPVRALYFLAVYGDNFVEGKFLALAQAIEAFHRRYHGGHYMDAAVYDRIVAQVLYTAIPTNIDASLRDSLKSRIRFGNEYSLRKRLGDLFAEHRNAITAILPDAERYIGLLVAKRNEVTHFPVDDTASEASDGEEWLRYGFILRLMLELCFLKTMGFGNDKIVALITSSYFHLGYAKRLFK